MVLKNENEFVRPPAVAGLFYPLDKEELAGSVNELLVRARENIGAEVPERY